ncbi:MAG TPA: helix-turn-helix domain-containing protein [Acidimicrobiales bacterium]
MTATLEDLFAAAVERGVAAGLAKHAQQPEKIVYTVAEAAHVLRIGESTVRRWVQQGWLPKLPHTGDKVLIPVAAVTGLVESTVAEWRRSPVRAA